MIILTSASPVSQHLSIPYPLNPTASHSLSTGSCGYAIKYPAHQRRCLCSMTLNTSPDTCTFGLCSGHIGFPALLEISLQKRLQSLSRLFRHIWIICPENMPNFGTFGANPDIACLRILLQGYEACFIQETMRI